MIKNYEGNKSTAKELAEDFWIIEIRKASQEWASLLKSSGLDNLDADEMAEVEKHIRKLENKFRKACRYNALT